MGTSGTYYYADLNDKKTVFSTLENTDFQHVYSCEKSLVFTGKEKDSETGYYYFGARYYDSDLSGLFLSVDPMSDKYPNISPYAYCAWNPVKLVDPDGEELVLIGTSDNIQKAIKMMSAKLGKKSNLSFSVDGKGRVICYGEAKTDTEKYMKGIIDNKEITVNLTVQESNVDQEGDKLYGGCFDGNKFKSDTKDQIDCFQTVDLITAKENDLLVGNEWLGQTIWHEIAEAYEGGCHSIDTKIEASKAYIDEYNPEYDQAHKAASKFFPASRKPVMESYELGFMKYSKLAGYVFE